MADTAIFDVDGTLVDSLTAAFARGSSSVTRLIRRLPIVHPGVSVLSESAPWFAKVQELAAQRDLSRRHGINEEGAACVMIAGHGQRFVP